MASPLEMTPEDVQLMLAADVHMGSRNCDANMAQYVFKRAPTGQHIINLAMTWEKLMLAARTIVAVENPEDVCVVSSKPIGQRAVYKFSQYAGSSYIANRYTPGTFTNQTQKAYMEPRVLFVTSPAADHQPINEAAYVNLPVIAFADVDDPLVNVDIAIPANNKSKNSIAALYWLLSREVMRLRGTLSRKEKWEVMVDLFIYREPEEVEKQAAEAAMKNGAEQGMPVGQPGYDAGYDGSMDYSQPIMSMPAVEPVAAAAPVASEGWGSAVETNASWTAPTTGGWEAPGSWGQ